MNGIVINFYMVCSGGDSAWEEENKKTYKNSELRLTEIQEMLCSEVSVGKDHVRMERRNKYNFI